MNSFSGSSGSDNTSLNPNTASEDYQERVRYDANGNILGYLRNGATAVHGLAMDSLSYKYDYYTAAGIRKVYTPDQPVPVDANRLTNQLNYVIDAAGGTYTEDIKTQSVDNYTYDKIGNLTADVKEGLSNIEWTVYGKISSLSKYNATTSSTTNISYTYDASGNRISKTVTIDNVAKTTYYVRDASGNVMSVYQIGETALNGGDLTQSEIHLYGSSRLGVYNVSTNVQCNSGMEDIITFIRGNKFFELSNHLGNVLATVSDRKIAVPKASPNQAEIDYYTADVITANDYYPFGMGMPGRKYNTSKLVDGFNGKVYDNEVYGEGNFQDYGMRMYDPRIVRFPSIDPITQKYPGLTPYQFASNSPVSGVDLDGLEYLTAIYTVTIKNGQNTVNAEYVWYNNQTHSNHGPLGQGVKYQIKINNLDRKTTTLNNYFVSRGENSSTSYFTQYGNYMGSDPLSNFNAFTGAIIKNTYRYDVEAVDFVDQQAKLHDQGYDRVKSVGASGLFSDFATTPYDEAAANAWTNFYDNNERGSIDPFNSQMVTIQERRAAWRGKELFNKVVSNKKLSITSFMSANYDEAKHGSKFLWGKTSFSKKDIASNYQMFLNKYMQKDKNGNWIRNDSMWNKNKDGNYTSPKTKEQLKNN